MKGFWMAMDAILFALAVALLIGSANQKKESYVQPVALSTFLEDTSFAASTWPDDVIASCTSGNPAPIRMRLSSALAAFPSDSFGIRCPAELSGAEIFISRGGEGGRFQIESGKIIAGSDGEFIGNVGFFAKGG